MAILNSTPPRLIERDIILDWDSVPFVHLKYRPLNDSNYQELDDPAKIIIDKMRPHIKDGYKSTLFDYKVFDLKSGDCGCALPEWHIDVTRNPNHKTRLDNHLIYTTIVGTDFLMTPIQTESIDFIDVKFDGAWMSAEPNSIYQYNRLNVHRGPIVKEDCKRVLIRLTQTDII